METNNEINIAIINFKLLFSGDTLDLVDGCKAHDTNNARQ